MSGNDNFDLQPQLEGQMLSLRPLREDDFEALYAVASDPLIWEQHPSPLRYQRPVFSQFFADGLASGGALLATDRASGAPIGSSRYYGWHAKTREVCIGYTFLARAWWGGATNAELKQLMLGHAFRWAETVWFHVGPNNIRSQKAMAKIGGELSHRSMVAMNGQAHDMLFFKIRRI